MPPTSDKALVHKSWLMHPTNNVVRLILFPFSHQMNLHLVNFDGDDKTPCNTARKGFTNSASSRWNADASDLASSWPSKFSKVNLTLTCLNSSTTRPEPDYEGTPTDYCKDHAVFYAGTIPSQFGLWNTGTDFQHIYSCHPQYLSIFKKTFRQSMVRNLRCSTCVTSVPIHW